MNRKIAIRLFRNKNIKMLPKAFFALIGMVLLTSLLIIGFVYTVFLLLSENGRKSFKSCYEFVFSTWKKIFSVGWYSLFPKSYYIFRDGKEIDYIDKKSMKKRGIYETENLLILSAKLSFDIIRKEDVVWWHLGQNTERLVTKVSRSEMASRVEKSIHIYTNRGNTYKFLLYRMGYGYYYSKSKVMTEEEASNLLSSCTNAIVGYNDLYLVLYKKDPEHFVENVKNNLII